MAKVRALRLSQNGPKGAIFEADGNRLLQLTSGPNPIAELVETKKAEKPKTKGGPKPSDAVKDDDGLSFANKATKQTKKGNK